MSKTMKIVIQYISREVNTIAHALVGLMKQFPICSHAFQDILLMVADQLGRKNYSSNLRYYD